ncbi:MAG: CesT family type III secretion system chaperone [Verrucomicrobiales bacterium]|nr:CesT family type III secretion system chaperone [Verrucomicrobiales bacterium]
MLIDEAISEFGRSLGIPSLTLGESGRLALSFGDYGELFFEKRPGEHYGEEILLVCLARDHGHQPEQAALRALEACHPLRMPREIVNVALALDGRLVLIIRLEEREVSLPSLESNLQLLKGLHDQASAA